MLLVIIPNLNFTLEIQNKAFFGLLKFFFTSANITSQNIKIKVLSSRRWRRHWHPTPALLPGKSMDGWAWWAAVHGVAKSRTRLSDFPFTFHFHALEKEMATHSSVLAWRIPGMGEPGGLPSMGSHRVGHYWSDLAAAAAAASNINPYIQHTTLKKRLKGSEMRYKV